MATEDRAPAVVRSFHLGDCGDDGDSASPLFLAALPIIIVKDLSGSYAVLPRELLADHPIPDPCHRCSSMARLWFPITRDVGDDGDPGDH
jgi:hypothetical protein